MILSNRCNSGNGKPYFIKKSYSIFTTLYTFHFSSLITFLSISGLIVRFQLVSNHWKSLSVFSPSLKEKGLGDEETISLPSGISTLISSSLRKYHSFVTSSLVNESSMR